ncbi:DUF6483 family protein [Xylocopilactobacillus apicola]|uniref:Uncharacterized protein n=1 Tax=Xylocopilactobacillus apicola TaxID=2932184 RepID=A0AAU9DDB2_9LACO|nr:DUF6483 family protein [Xylocopilactobacillus apicola]BDR58802.1 hypothetical protein XA3_12430 [Xylocopilactobacillus apicola]
MQNDEKDWIVRQVKSFAQGLGYLLGHGKSNPGSEIVFPKEYSAPLPHQKDLQKLIDQRQYQQSVTEFKGLRYAMEEELYLKLGNWLYSNLSRLDEDQLQAGHFSKAQIDAEVEELSQISLDL